MPLPLTSPGLPGCVLILPPPRWSLHSQPKSFHSTYVRSHSVFHLLHSLNWLYLFIYLFTAFRDASLGSTLTGIHWAELNRKWWARFVLIWVKQTFFFFFPLLFKLTWSDVILPKYLCVLKSWKNTIKESRELADTHSSAQISSIIFHIGTAVSGK